jgi:aspartate aminotransferase
LGEESVGRLSALLEKKQREYGHPIYLISDEPYRELVYSGEKLPYFTNYYENTVVCYSFSKSLSLPGERIGYILVSSRAWEAKALFEAICGAGRALGFVCAPSLFQRMIPACLGMTADVEIYRKNRDLLCGALTEMGFRIAPPDGAFYLFVQAPGGDATAFSEMARELELLLVPSDDFGCEGFVRISYCVSTEQIISSLPAFRELARRCGMDKNR